MKKVIGIIGGVGPLAGVELQQLITTKSPAHRDQDHIVLICYTNPEIPDRTESLKNDGGDSFVREMIATANKLVNAGSTAIAIPCNTAHARLSDIQKEVSVPILDMVSITLRKAHNYGLNKAVLFATTGTVLNEVYQSRAQKNIEIITPSEEDQIRVTQIIYNTKANGKSDTSLFSLEDLIQRYDPNNTIPIILGCTELSLYHEFVKRDEALIIDPLRDLADHIIEYYYNDIEIGTSDRYTASPNQGV